MTNRSCGGATLAVVVALSLASVVPPATGARTLHEPAWVPNGSVLDTARVGDRLLVAGDFTSIGRRTGPAALFGPGGALQPGLNGVFSRGTVEAFASDGSGGWFVGGSFRRAGGASSGGLAHLRADGTIDPDFTPAIRYVEGRTYQGIVRGLAASGGRLYVGGTFSHVDGSDRNGLAAFDLATGALTSWNPAPDNGWIEALELDGSTVYAGGWFSEIGGVPRSGVAAIDGTTGIPTSWNPDVGGGVQAILVRDGSVYLGGEFGAVGGMTREYLAEVSQATGAVTAWQPQVPGAVRALEADAASVYAGVETDEFSEVGEPALFAFARTDGVQQWTKNARRGSGVAGLSLDGTTLYVAGGFDRIGGVGRSGLASIHTTDGSVQSWAPRPNLVRDRSAYPQPAISALAVVSGGVMAGGAFTSVGGAAHRGLALVDPLTWKPTRWNPRVAGSVNGIARQSGTTYIVGDFERVGGRARNEAAAFDRRLRLRPWNPRRLHSGPADDVSVLDGKVILTGSFNSVFGARHGSLAAFHPVTAALLDWGEPGVQGTGFTYLGVRGEHVYTLLHGEPFTVMLLDRGTGLIERRLFPHNADVYAAAWAGRTLYVGGAFSRVGGKTRARLAAVDALTGRVLPWQSTVNEDVFSLARIGRTLYVAGQFDQVGGQDRFGLAAIDTSTGALRPWNPGLIGFSGSVRRRIVSGSLFTYTGTDMPFLAILR